MELPTIKELAQGVIGLFYPEFCAACGIINHIKNQPVCLFCEHALKPTGFELLEDNAFIRKFWGRIEVGHATSAYYMTKGSVVQNMLHSLKYEGNKDVGIWSGVNLGLRLKKSKYYKDIDFIIPIPLHIRKLRFRGYNQSTQFAIGLSQSMDVPFVDNMLLRKQNNVSQTKQTREERLKNVYHAFSLKSKFYFKGKHVLIVDDVVTTGSTLESCALLFGPEVKVSFATIAFASYY